MKKAGRMANRIFSLFLAFAMLCTIPDITAFAQTADTPTPQAELSTGDVISFGSYPQTEVTGTALTDAIVNASYDSNGDATVGSERYRRYKKAVKVTTEEYRQYMEKKYPDKDYSLHYPDTSTAEECEKEKTEREGTYRYFKWEPVKWKVLQNETGEGTLFVMADTVLDAVNYCDDVDVFESVLWEDSTLRQWMNTDFYHMAFSNAEQAAVEANAENPEGDLVYLLSDEEATNADYGFENTEDASAGRKMNASAYAEARRASIASGADYSCSWYLRTLGDSLGYVKIVSYDGAIRSNESRCTSGYNYIMSLPDSYYERTFDGCVPVMHIDASYVAQAALNTARNNALNDLDLLESKLSDYRAAEQEKIKKAIAEAKAKIDAAEDEDAVKKALEAARQVFDEQPTDAELKKQEEKNDPSKSLSLNKTNVTLYTGKASNSITVNPTVTGASRTVTWKTDNPKVATVQNGRITAVGKGTATITATANGISKTVRVTVKDPTLTIKKGTKKFTKSKLTVKKKKKEVLTVTVSPKNSGISIGKLTAKQKKTASVTLKKGKITIKGKKKGTFNLQIKSGKTTKKIKITVK